METYNIVPSQGGWGVSQNKTGRCYAIREGAFEADLIAASNESKGRGGTINEPARLRTAIGGTP